MNIQKFTQKSMEAVQDCEKLAYEYGNQEIEQEHLLLALLQQQDGLIPKLIEKMEIDLNYFTNDAISMVEARTKVSGGGQVYMGKYLNEVLIHAEDEAKTMGDDYVSVEHLFLSLIKHPNKAIKDKFKEFNLAKYAKMSFGMFSGDPEKVKIAFDNEMAGVFIDRFGRDIFINPAKQKGWSEITVDVTMSDQFLGWIFALGPKVKIVGPKTVVDRFKAEIKEMNKLYG